MSTMRRRPLGSACVCDFHPLQMAVMSLSTWSSRTCLGDFQNILQMGLAFTALSKVTRSTAVKITFPDSTLH
jgi:hypothetical protein